MSDLVERLREAADRCDPYDYKALLEVTAEIERLQKEVARLNAELDYLNKAKETS